MEGNRLPLSSLFFSLSHMCIAVFLCLSFHHSFPPPFTPIFLFSPLLSVPKFLLPHLILISLPSLFFFFLKFKITKFILKFILILYPFFNQSFFLNSLFRNSFCLFSILSFIFKLSTSISFQIIHLCLSKLSFFQNYFSF